MFSRRSPGWGAVRTDRHVPQLAKHPVGDRLATIGIRGYDFGQSGDRFAEKPDPFAKMAWVFIHAIAGMNADRPNPERNVTESPKLLRHPHNILVPGISVREKRQAVADRRYA